MKKFLLPAIFIVGNCFAMEELQDDLGKFTGELHTLSGQLEKISVKRVRPVPPPRPAREKLPEGAFPAISFFDFKNLCEDIFQQLGQYEIVLNRVYNQVKDKEKVNILDFGESYRFLGNKAAEVITPKIDHFIVYIARLFQKDSYEFSRWPEWKRLVIEKSNEIFGDTSKFETLYNKTRLQVPYRDQLENMNNYLQLINKMGKGILTNPSFEEILKDQLPE